MYSPRPARQLEGFGNVADGYVKTNQDRENYMVDKESWCAKTEN